MCVHVPITHFASAQAKLLHDAVEKSSWKYADWWYSPSSESAVTRTVCVPASRRITRSGAPTVHILQVLTWQYALFCPCTVSSSVPSTYSRIVS